MKNNVYSLPNAKLVQTPKLEPVAITLIMPKKTITGHLVDLALLAITGLIMGAVFTIGAFL